MHRPIITGPWHTIAPMPDLHRLNGSIPRKQNVVDHGFIQDASGQWQLWACIRGTATGRLIFGWESDSLATGPWRERGVMLRADTACGERIHEGLEHIGAPFFLRKGQKWFCFYHSNGIRVLTSSNGRDYERATDWGPSGNLTGIPGGRDVMIMHHHGLYYSYATITADDSPRSYVVAATSPDLHTWSVAGNVCEAAAADNGKVSAESPFVVFYEGWFYLWRASSHDFLTSIYRSRDPLDFGVGHYEKRIDEIPLKAPEILYSDGKWWITDLHDFQGLRIAEMTWQSV